MLKAMSKLDSLTGKSMWIVDGLKRIEQDYTARHAQIWETVGYIQISLARAV